MNCELLDGLILQYRYSHLRRYIGLEESVQQLANFMFDYTKLNR